MSSTDSNNLDLERLSKIFENTSKIFENTSTTYKYYWSLALLDNVVKNKRKSVSFAEMITNMMGLAWRTVNNTELSFGHHDSMRREIDNLREYLNIPANADKETVIEIILKNAERERVMNSLKIFYENVPYRFLSPWIRFTNKSEVAKLSQLYLNNCIYAIEEERIILNPAYINFVITNYISLQDFAYQGLVQFLEKRNPQVENIYSMIK